MYMTVRQTSAWLTCLIADNLDFVQVASAGTDDSGVCDGGDRWTHNRCKYDSTRQWIIYRHTQCHTHTHTHTHLLRGLSDKSCDSHIRALRILILSSLLWYAASKKQMKLSFKRILATTCTLKKIAAVGTGGQQTTFSTFFYPKKFIIVLILNISFYISEAYIHAL